MTRRDTIVALVESITGSRVTAEMVVERLQEEGVLQLGYGNGDVERVVQTFKDSFGTTRTSQQDRFAAHRLCQQYGAQAVAGIIQLLAKRAKEPYLPVVNSVSELERKWVSVLNFLRKKDADAEAIEVINLS
jgi:hypothetical protein